MDEMLTKNTIRFNDWEPAAPLPGSQEKRKAGRHMNGTRNPFMRKYLILIVGAAVFTLYTILLSSWVNYRAGKEAQSAVTTTENHIFDVLGISREQFQEMEKAKTEGKPAILTGAESFNQYVEGEVIAVAKVISKLSTEQQKYTEASCMLARVMSPDYPNDFESVAKQPQQWMFYDGTDNSYSERDKEIAESIVRPWLVNQTYPSGLTKEMVHGRWSPNDYVLRDSYDTTPTMNTWRYGG